MKCTYSCDEEDEFRDEDVPGENRKLLTHTFPSFLNGAASANEGSLYHDASLPSVQLISFIHSSSFRESKLACSRIYIGDVLATRFESVRASHYILVLLLLQL